MRTSLIYCLCSALLCTAGSCKKEEVLITATSALLNTCAGSSPTVKTATDLVGILGFNTALQKYYIGYHQPGTYDSIDAGILCGTVPENLQVVGAKVVFSGNYKTYDNSPPSPSTTFYYLELTKIAIQ